MKKLRRIEPTKIETKKCAFYIEKMLFTSTLLNNYLKNHKIEIV